MNEEEKLYEQIEHFLDKTLSPQENAHFELRIHEDKVLANEVENLRTARFIVKAGRLLELKEQLEGYSKELSSTNTKKGTLVKMLPWILAVAASIVITIGIFSWHGMGNKNIQLYSDYYTPYPNLILPLKMGERKEKVINNKEEAFSAYDEEDYVKAIPLFKLALSQKEDPTISFYLGSAYLGANLPQDAASTFAKLLNETTTEFTFFSQTLWYLSLSYINLDETEKARKILEDLRNRKGDYSLKATELLHKLE